VHVAMLVYCDIPNDSCRILFQDNENVTFIFCHYGHHDFLLINVLSDFADFVPR